MKRKKMHGSGVNTGVETGVEAESSTIVSLNTSEGKSQEHPPTENRPKGGLRRPSLPQSLHEAVAYFSNDLDVCTEFLAAVRWPDGPVCPACGCKAHSYISTRRIWKCKDCRKQYSAKMGTIFEDSPIPLDKWMMALWLIVNCKNGVSSYEIAKDLKITQKSAWFMLHRLREAVNTSRGFGAKPKLGSGDAGQSAVEADETFVGGKIANMHADRKARLKLKDDFSEEPSYKHKTIVMGMLDRDLRQVRANVIPNVQRETLQNEILKHVKHGSRVYTDEWRGYNLLHYRFVHDVVNHMETYVNGQVHTQGIENFWSLLKRTLKGTYVAVEPFHLQRYVDEQVFRFDNRGKNKTEDRAKEGERFLKALSQVVGKRLTYAKLTGKSEAGTTF